MKFEIKKLQAYILYFFMYSVFGWLYEVFLEVVVYRWGFTNRGFLFGPYTPVYGFGAIMFLLLIYPLINKKDLFTKIKMIIPVFLGCMLLATSLELVTSYLMEWTTGAWPWQTYKDYTYHFQARIALSPSIRFGLGGTLFLYVIQPIFEKIKDRLSHKQVKYISVMIVVLLSIDLVYTVFFR